MLGQFIALDDPNPQPPPQPIMRYYTLPRTGIRVVAPDPLPVYSYDGGGDGHTHKNYVELSGGGLSRSLIMFEPPDEGGQRDSIPNTQLEEYIYRNQFPLYLRHTRRIAQQEDQENIAPEHLLPPLPPPPLINLLPPLNLEDVPAGNLPQQLLDE